MNIAAHGISHPGHGRPRNEDAFVADADRGLFAVADGLGGLPEGALASRIAIEVLERAFANDGPPSDLHGLARIVRTAHAHILAEGRARHPDTGIGTTLTVSTLHEESLLIGHTGDSVAFLYRRGMPLRALTTEHNLAAVYRPRLPPGEALPSYFEHTLTQCLGMSEPLKPDFILHPVEPGDRILLCTDGITKVLKPARIGAILAKARTPEAANLRLQKAVLSAGAPDNLTAVAVFFD